MFCIDYISREKDTENQKAQPLDTSMLDLRFKNYERRNIYCLSQKKSVIRRERRTAGSRPFCLRFEIWCRLWVSVPFPFPLRVHPAAARAALTPVCDPHARPRMAPPVYRALGEGRGVGGKAHPARCVHGTASARCRQRRVGLSLASVRYSGAEPRSRGRPGEAGGLHVMPSMYIEFLSPTDMKYSRTRHTVSQFIETCHPVAQNTLLKTNLCLRKLQDHVDRITEQKEWKTHRFRRHVFLDKMD